MTHNVTEIQKRLIELGYLAAGEDDGIFGPVTLAAYNRFRASKGEPPHTGLLLLGEISADVFPEDAPPPKPASNPLDNPLVKLGLSLLLPQLLKGLPMGNIFNALSGAKTYIAGIAMILTGIADYVQPGIVPGSGSFTPLAWVIGGIALVGVRNAIATSLVAILEKLTGTDPANLPK